MHQFLSGLDEEDRLVAGGIVLQSLGFALLPLSLSALGLIVPGLWVTGLGLLLGRKAD